MILFDAHTLFDNILQYETYPDFDLSEEAEFDIADNARILESKQDESPHSYQARCYKGSYLGETDPSFVCDNSQRAVFWDVVHPTTYVHCWVAFGLHRRMHDAGWTRPTPEISEVGDWCEGVADLPQGTRSYGCSATCARRTCSRHSRSEIHDGQCCNYIWCRSTTGHRC